MFSLKMATWFPFDPVNLPDGLLLHPEVLGLWKPKQPV